MIIKERIIHSSNNDQRLCRENYASRQLRIIKRKRFFTLVELLLILMILSLIAGLIGININKAIREQRFKTEVSLVVDKLRLAQNLMLILHGDVHVKFTSEKGGEAIKMWLEVDDSNAPEWVKQFQKSPKLLKAIQFINFQDNDNQSEYGKIDLKFLSGGTVMSRGLLRLSTSESNMAGALERFITLSGYPQNIVASRQEPDKPTHKKGENADFSEKLTTFQTQEIFEKGLPEASEHEQQHEQQSEQREGQSGRRDDTTNPSSKKKQVK